MAKPHDTMVSVSNGVADLTARKPHGWYYSMPAVDVQGGNVNRRAMCVARFLRTLKQIYIMSTQTNQTTAAQPTPQPTTAAQPQPLPIVVKLTPNRPYERSIYFKTAKVQNYCTLDTDLSKSLSCISNWLLANSNNELLPLIAAEIQARPHLKASDIYAKIAPIINGTIVQVEPIVLEIGDVHPETLTPMEEQTTYNKVVKAKLPAVPQIYVERCLNYIENLPLTPQTQVTAANVTDPFA